MNTIMKSARKALSAVAVAVAVLAPLPASAVPTQLGFILDRSGSIGSGNWGIITSGLAGALLANLPLGGLYEVSVVSFAGTASINVDSFLVTDAASRTNLAGQITAIPFSGGSTNMAAAFSSMQTALFPAGAAGPSYVNLATDGVPDSQSAATAARDALIAAGVDNLSIEAIGTGVNSAYLQNTICYPQACDTTVPFNFPAQGFYIPVASAADFGAAVAGKIRVITQVPEPGTLLLLGAGLAVAALTRRRREQSQA